MYIYVYYTLLDYIICKYVILIEHIIEHDLILYYTYFLTLSDFKLLKFLFS